MECPKCRTLYDIDNADEIDGIYFCPDCNIELTDADAKRE